MKIYVVIVTYNGVQWIRGALDSLRASEATCTVIVVDNASTDDTAAIVAKEYAEMRFLQQAENVGFGRGNNVGIRLAILEGADYIFLLNQDAYITPPALRDLAGFLHSHSEFSVVTPLHCSPDPGSVDPQTQRGYLQRYAPGYLSDACIGSIREFYEIRGINAAAWMVRAEAFMRVGGCDPLYFMYGEDDDLIARFHHLHERFALLPASRIVHLRAKAPRPRRNTVLEVFALSERIRSQLMVDLKRPEGRLIGRLARLLAGGLVQPVANLLADHDWREAVASVVATARLLYRLPRVLRSSRQCAGRGAHFLGIDTK